MWVTWLSDILSDAMIFSEQKFFLEKWHLKSGHLKWAEMMYS